MKYLLAMKLNVNHNFRWFPRTISLLLWPSVLWLSIIEMVLRLYNKDLSLFVCAYVCTSANAVSSRDGLDTETGTESLQSQRRERERERAHRRARESEWLWTVLSKTDLFSHYTHITYHVPGIRKPIAHDMFSSGDKCLAGEWNIPSIDTWGKKNKKQTAF